jgi:hypothetical protein
MEEEEGATEGRSGVGGDNRVRRGREARGRRRRGVRPDVTGEAGESLGFGLMWLIIYYANAIVVIGSTIDGKRNWA